MFDSRPNNIRGIVRCSACQYQWAVTTDHDVEEALEHHFADGHVPVAVGSQLHLTPVGNGVVEYFVGSIGTTVPPG